MARVPILRENTVALAPLSGARLQPANNGGGVLGGLGAGITSLGGAIGKAAEVQDEIDLRNDDLERQRKTVTFQKVVLPLLTDFKALEGEAAVDARAALEQRIASIRDQLVGEASTPRARTMLADSIAQYEAAYAGDINAHGVQQRDVVEQQLYDARVRQTLEDATVRWDSPDAFKMNSETLRSLVDGRLDRKGVHDPELRARDHRLAQSALSRATIGAMVRNNNIGKALEHKAEYGHVLIGTDREAVEDLLREPLLRRDTIAKFYEAVPEQARDDAEVADDSAKAVHESAKSPIRDADTPPNRGAVPSGSVKAPGNSEKSPSEGGGPLHHGAKAPSPGTEMPQNSGKSPNRVDKVPADRDGARRATIPARKSKAPPEMDLDDTRERIRVHGRSAGWDLETVERVQSYAMELFSFQQTAIQQRRSNARETGFSIASNLGDGFVSPSQIPAEVRADMSPADKDTLTATAQGNASARRARVEAQKIVRQAEQQPNFPWDPFSHAHHLAIRIMTEASRRDVLENGHRLYARTGIAPDSLLTQLAQSIRSKDPQKVRKGADIASRMLRINPNVFMRRKYDTLLENAGHDYGNALDQGKSPAEAVEWLIRGRAADAVRGKRSDQETAAASVNDSVLADLRTMFGIRARWGDMAEWQKAHAAYVDLVLGEKHRGASDADARAAAQRTIKRSWAVTDSGEIRQYPMELTYPRIRGGYDHIYHDLRETVRVYTGRKTNPISVQIIPVPGVTDNDFRQGRGEVRYQVLYSYRKRDGQLSYNTLPKLWYYANGQAEKYYNWIDELKFRRTQRRVMSNNSRYGIPLGGY